MRLLTVQCTDILDNSIKNNHIYYMDETKGSDMEICPRLIEETKEKINGHYPIFTLRSIGDHYFDYDSCNKISKADYNNFTCCVFSLAEEETYKHMSFYLLEVPDNECYLTHLFGWRAQMKFEAEYDRKIVDEESEWLGTYTIEAIPNESTQAIIPYIKKEYIIDSIKVSDLLNKIK